MADIKPKPLLETLKTEYGNKTCPNGLGAIEILAKAEKIAARIYVRNRMVYAIDISNFPVEIIRRIVTSEYITESNRELLLQKYDKNLNHPSVLDYAVEHEMIPLAAGVAYVKDLFLGAFDYLRTIPTAQFKWKPDVTPVNISAPEIELDRLWKIVETRHEELKKIAEDFTVGEHQVRDLTFKKTNTTMRPSTQTEANIYSLATGEWSLLDFSRSYGMSLLLTAYEMKKLWLKGGITLIYDSEFKLYPTEAQQNTYRLENSIRETVPVKAVQDSIPAQVEKTPTVVEKTQPVESATSDDKTIDTVKLLEHLNAVEAHVAQVRKIIEGNS